VAERLDNPTPHPGQEKKYLVKKEQEFEKGRESV
jgi:hypothetical protein